MRSVKHREVKARATRGKPRISEELYETLQAIRGGQVDAVVVSGADGDRVYTLQGAEHPYRVLVEAMNEGAATLDRSGVVLYCNSRFGEILGIRLEKLLGT